MRTGEPPSPEEEAAGGIDDEPGQADAGGDAASLDAGHAAPPALPEAAAKAPVDGEPAVAAEDEPDAAPAAPDGPKDVDGGGPPGGATGGDPPTPPPNGPNGPRKPNTVWVLVLGTIILLAFGVALIASLVNLWPAIEAFTG